MKKDFLDLYNKYVHRGIGYKSQIIDDIETRGNNLIKKVNDLNNDLFETTGLFASGVSNIRKRMAEISDMNLSISAASGNTNSQYDIISGNIKDVKNISKIAGRIFISPLTASKSSILDVSISSNGHIGNSVDYEEKRNYDINSIITDSPLEIESFSSQLVVYITCSLSKRSPLNIIKFKYVDFGIQNFEISSVDITGDNKSYKRVNFDSYIVDNDISIEFDEISAIGFRITLSQRNSYISKSGQRRYPIGISNLSCGLKTSHEDGYIVFGPFASAREILKCSVLGNIKTLNKDSVSFEISNDNISWHEVSMPYSDNNIKKHIDFNTVNNDSIKTEVPVNSLYFRIKLRADSIKKAYSGLGIDSHTQQVSRINNRIYTPFNIRERYIVGESLGVIYGGTISHSRYYDRPEDIDSITSIRNDSGYFIKSISPMEPISGAIITSGLHKCRLESDNGYKVIPSSDIDISTSEIYAGSNPTKRSVRVMDSKDIVISFKEMAGIYTLTDGKNIRRVDLSSGFFESCYQWTYKKHNEDVYLINPVGQRVFIFNKGEDINLLNYFTYEAPVHADKSPFKVIFNKDYPLSPLKENDFSIVDGKIRSANNSAIVNCESIIYEKMSPSFSIGINNSSISIDNARLAKRTEKLEMYSGSHMAKLSKSRIIKGSAKFSNKSASSNSFIKEVDYINGIDEFDTGSKSEVRIPKGKNQFSLGKKIDHFSDIGFVGHIDIFKSKVYSEDELINYGDYMLKDTESETLVILPNGVKTHEIIETFAIIDGAIPSVGAGYYSIDYNNGIIYSKSPISGETEVEYLYSNVFISGRKIRILNKDEYSVSQNGVEIKTPSDNSTISVLSQNDDHENISILKSPVVSGLILNTVTV